MTFSNVYGQYGAVYIYISSAWAKQFLEMFPPENSFEKIDQVMLTCLVMDKQGQACQNMHNNCGFCFSQICDHHGKET